MRMSEHVTIGDVLHRLDAVAPLAKAAGWDPVGLQVGDRSAEVRRIAVCHEVSSEITHRLEAEPVDLLIAYHPLLFRPTASVVAGSDAAGRAFRLIRAGVGLAVVHTAFDVAPGGAADALAEALDLHDVVSFGPNWGSDSETVTVFVPETGVESVAEAMLAAGAGVIGNYSGCTFRSEGLGTYRPEEGARPSAGAVGALEQVAEVRLEVVTPVRKVGAVVAAMVAAHPYEEPAYNVTGRRGDAGFIGRRGSLATPMPLAAFAARVSERLGGVVRTAGDRGREVAVIAVVPGSGSSFAGAAAPADVLVTGDVRHHDARSAVDGGMAIVDPGHAPTERPGMAKLYDSVSQIGEVTNCHVIDLTAIDADPWEG